MGNVIARVMDPEWHSVITAESARIQTEKNGDRFLVLSQGHRYDLKPGKTDFRMIDFERYGFRLESKVSANSIEAVRQMAEREIKARQTATLFMDNNDNDQVGRAHCKDRGSQDAEDRTGDGS